MEALILILLVLQFADFFTTKNALESGKGREANPVMRWVIEKWGTTGLLFSKVVIAVPLLYYYSLIPVWAILVVIVGYGYVVWNNWRIYA